jgi:hypothetical protein
VPNGSATINLSTGSAGQYVFATLATPVVLSANTTYFLLTQEFAGGDQWYQVGPVSSSPGGPAINSAAYQSGSTYFAVGAANSAYGPPNLKYQ